MTSSPSKRRTTRGPSSFFLLLIVACLIGAAFLLQDPDRLDRISYVIFGGRQPVAAAEASSVKPAAPKSPGKVVKPARNSSTTHPNTETTQPNAAAIPAAPEGGAVEPAPETPPVKPDPSRATVKTDSVVAYSSSSENSSVVSVLKKDTPVQTTLELLNSEGRWTMIKIEGSGRPAYVRSEDLQRPTR